MAAACRSLAHHAVATRVTSVSSTPRTIRSVRPAQRPAYRTLACRAGPSDKQESSSSSSSALADSDAAFLAKLALVSFGGGALIKYGSLLLDVPFQPNAVLAVAVVLGVPGAFAVKILTTGRM